MKKQLGYTAVELMFVVLGLVAITGWVKNIVDLAHTSLTPLTGMAVLRVVGIFVAPLGCILGYL